MDYKVNRFANTQTKNAIKVTQKYGPFSPFVNKHVVRVSPQHCVCNSPSGCKQIIFQPQGKECGIKHMYHFRADFANHDRSFLRIFPSFAQN